LFKKGEYFMKRLQLLYLLGVAFLALGFTKVITPLEGVYDVKFKTLTFLDLANKDIPFQSVAAELTESQPAGLNVGIDLSKLREPTFGSLKLGNNDQKVWFVMGKGERGYWTEVYLDQNGDFRITRNEKLKGIQTGDLKERKLRRNSAYTMVPVAIKVGFKGVNKYFQKKLYYFFYADIVSNKTETFTVAGVSTASFADGEFKVAIRKELKLVKFRIYDINGNGCFNDYGADMIYLDLNYDGLFKKNEGRKLTEFFDYRPTSKQVKQYRLLVTAQPAKLAVIDSFQEFDRSKLEAAPDPDVDESDANPEGQPEKSPANQEVKPN
jgi:hypothetical protein